MQQAFSDLGLSPKVLEAVTAAGYTSPTPIQARSIPIAVAGRDVLGIAQTGTGKTAAFVLPMLCRLERGRARARMPRSLILAPTRELAAQVAEHFSRFDGQHKLSVALIIGGVSFEDQNRKLDRGADVLIATPGRLLDHFQRGKLLLTGVEILVIDEADRMLDMGFIPDIERICSLLPPARQTLFFSATMPPEIQRLVDRFLKDPERVEVARPATTAKTITQRFCRAPADPAGKRGVLRELIRSQQVKNAIIFCNRKRDVAILHRSLLRHGFNAGALHGDLDQHQRTATLESFRAGTLTLLAASDVAARGLDIPEVSHIFNYDVPLHSDDYVHRIGRTGRAGREGFAATLVTPLDGKLMRGVEKLVGGPIEWLAGIEAPPGRDRPERSPRGEERGRGRRRERDQQHGRERSQRGSAEQPEVVETGEPAVERPVRQPRPERRRERPEQSERAAPPQARNRDHGASQRRGRERSGEHRSGAEPRRPRRDEGLPVIGMGDHVPEFMKRSVKV